MKKIVLRVMAWLMVVAMSCAMVSGAKTVQAASYAGDYSEGYTIPLSALAVYDGDVTMTVEYTEVSGYEYYQLKVFYKDANWQWVELKKSDFAKLDNNLNDWGFIELANGKNSITMTLDEDIVKKAIAEGKGMGIQVYGVIIDDVTFGGKATENKDAAYPGDYALGYTVNTSELQDIKGDVRVTVDYTQVSKGYDYYQLIIFNKVEGWPKLSKSDFAELNHVYNAYDCVELVAGESSMSFVLTESAVKKIVNGGGGLGFQVYGIIINDVTVSSTKEAPEATVTPAPTQAPEVPEEPKTDESGAKIFTYAGQTNKKQVTELSMQPEETVDLCFLGVPDYGDYKCDWVSSNEAVATVDKMGIITAKSQGIAEITLKIGDGTAYTSEPVEVSIITMNLTIGNSANKAMEQITLKKGDTFDFNFYGVTDWSSRKKAYLTEWTTSESAVASVEQATGVLTAEAEGTSVVMFHIYDTEKNILLSSVPVIVVVTE